MDNQLPKGEFPVPLPAEGPRPEEAARVNADLADTLYTFGSALLLLGALIRAPVGPDAARLRGSMIKTMRDTANQIEGTA